MIEEIEIADLGVIASATLPLGSGFTAITGETGAGKTMVVTALGLLLGGRADSGTVRAGASQARVDGRWIVEDTGHVADRVREAGGDVDAFGGDGLAELTLGRTVTAEGRSRAQVGGRSAPNGVLTELGERLVAVHGQSDQIRLRSQSAQRGAVDRAAGAELDEVLARYREAFARWRSEEQELATLTRERDARSAEAAELREAMDEIEAAAPRPGEDDELAATAEKLTNLEELRLSASAAREAISSELVEGGDVLALIENARRSLERVTEFDDALAPIAEQLANLSYLASEAAGELSSYLASLDADGSNELEAINERRAVLGTLMRRHGPSLDDVIAALDQGSARLLELDSDSDRIEQLTRQVEEDGVLVASLAAETTAIRTRAAERLGTAISEELSALAMPDASVIIAVSDTGEYSRNGRDEVQFLLRAHAGAEPRPLSKGASGGELSRVMLAIEVVISASDPVPTYVFDEVDAGVGGAAAIEIGRRLARLSQHAQVIVVTHLAQVAAFATNHLTVVKESDGFVTHSSVKPLEGEARTEEMARLLSGLSDSDTGLAHAEELLELARSDSRLIG
ncbi:DNA replication and repair protein RecN [Paramicrobacterium humi]|uniref:DNA repair protein RecN n=1 Tax=Paramicrobacterium humi TaxID=640635 RepID=A0A1H4PXV6_9MICO|nr:DNA repair protein RecN [Microbacterium humi]SEC12130.1 DNA replication and repair protein RecN [Microbacterium humi]